MLEPVIVTASRFASDLAFPPIGATVISAEQIREAGIGNVNQAIRKIGGVYGRQNFSGTQDFSLDLRGFGANSDQNLVILVDGIRLSENELSPAQLSSIPIELVERIEIVRGGSSVLYGEGATAGTIQVITKRAPRNATRGALVTEFGSFGYKELRASAAKGWDGFALDANIGSQRADNYRDNNAVKQDNFSGGMQWSSNEGRIGVRIDAARQNSRFPGPLSLAQFESNPRQTLTPNDTGALDMNRYTLFGERRLGEWEAAAELSQRDKTTKGMFVSSFGAFESKYDTRVTQFSPRLRHSHTSGAVKNELVIGMDFSNWTRVTNSNFAGSPTSKADASQKARALYVRDELKIGNTRIALGARHENFDKKSVDPVPFTTGTYTKSQALNAWELQGNYAAAPDLNLFAKAGRSYRMPNVDENGFTPTPNQPLEPQTSRDLEFGAAFGNAERKITARVFQHRLRNEIFYNPIAGAFGFGANVNLDPTKREGVELEASARLLPAWVLSAKLQHVSAKFTDGPNAGKEIPLVPSNNASLRLNWQPGSGQSADVGMQWVDTQRYGGDFTNACGVRMPSFTTFDARYAKRVGAWELAIAGSNLTDKKYFTNAFGACRSGIYPDAGRQLKITARLDF